MIILFVFQRFRNDRNLKVAYIQLFIVWPTIVIEIMLVKNKNQRGKMDRRFSNLIFESVVRSSVRKSQTVCVGSNRRKMYVLNVCDVVSCGL